MMLWGRAVSAQAMMLAKGVALLATLAAAGYAGWTLSGWRCDSRTAAITRQLSEWQTAYDVLSRATVEQNAAVNQWQTHAKEVQANAADALKRAQGISEFRQKEIASLKRRIAAGGASCIVAIGEIKGEL